MDRIQPPLCRTHVLYLYVLKITPPEKLTAPELHVSKQNLLRDSTTITALPAVQQSMEYPNHSDAAGLDV